MLRGCYGKKVLSKIFHSNENFVVPSLKKKTRYIIKYILKDSLNVEKYFNYKKCDIIFLKFK